MKRLLALLAVLTMPLVLCGQVRGPLLGEVNGFSQVQETHNLTFSAIGQPILTTISNVTKDDLLIAWIESSSPAYQTIADSKNTWIPIAALRAGGYGKVSAWYAIAARSAPESLQFYDSNITPISNSWIGVPLNLNYPAAQLIEFRGNSLNPFDAYSFATGTGTTPASAVTTALANELVVGIGIPASTSSGLVTSSWTNAAGSSTAYSANYMVEAAAGSYTPGFTQTTGTWGALSVAFKPANLGATISGALGSAGAGATVNFQSQTTGIQYRQTADGSGNYTSSLAPDTYTVVPQLVGQLFTPTSASIAVTTTATQNFTAASVSTSFTFTTLATDTMQRANENPLSNGGAWVVDGTPVPPFDPQFQILNNEGTFGPLGTVNTYSSSGWSTPLLYGDGGFLNAAGAYLLGASGQATNPTWAFNTGHNAYIFTAAFKTVSGNGAFVSGATEVGETGATTINTTGATLLVAVMSTNGTPTMIDAQGNTWHKLTQAGYSGNNGVISYSYDHGGSPLVTSATHSFSMSTSSLYPGFVVYAFSGTTPGVDPFDVTHQIASAASGVGAGSITPTLGDILVSGWGNPYQSTTTTSITGSGQDVAGYRVLWASGPEFDNVGQHNGTAWIAPGSTIWINNVAYTVATYDSQTLLTLTTSAGTQAGAVYNAVIDSLIGPHSVGALSEYTGISWPNDQWAEIQIDTLNSAPLSWAATALIMRTNWSGTIQFVGFYPNPDGTVLITGPAAGVGVTVPFTPGDKFRAVCIGTTGYVLHNGTVVANFPVAATTGFVTLWALGHNVTDVGISHFIGGSVTH